MRVFDNKIGNQWINDEIGITLEIIEFGRDRAAKCIKATKPNSGWYVGEWHRDDCFWDTAYWRRIITKSQHFNTLYEKLTA